MQRLHARDKYSWQDSRITICKFFPFMPNKQCLLVESLLFFLHLLNSGANSIIRLTEGGKTAPLVDEHEHQGKNGGRLMSNIAVHV